MDEGEFLASLVCQDYIRDHLIPMIKNDGKDVAIQRLSERNKFRPEISKKIIDYLVTLI